MSGKKPGAYGICLSLIADKEYVAKISCIWDISFNKKFF